MAFTQAVLKELPQWQKFIKDYELTELQQNQFARYFELLSEYNELFNLTAIIQPEEIVAYHFQDSLAVSKFVDFESLHMIADVEAVPDFRAFRSKLCSPILM